MCGFVARCGGWPTILPMCIATSRTVPVPFGNLSLLLGWMWCTAHGLLEPVRVIVSLVYQVARKLLAVPALLLRRDVAKEAELPT
jgi:hypothetical protein